MSPPPCLHQVIGWLAAQTHRVRRDAVTRQFALNNRDLDALLAYLRERELIKDVACLGPLEVVQSFVPAPAARRLADEMAYCPGYGQPRDTPPRDRVFLVHGRDLDAARAITVFLGALGLQTVTFQEAIRLTGKTHPYIDETVSAGMRSAYATVVLFTGDDEARLRECHGLTSDPPSAFELQSQPRPNVIFEAGMALARDPQRTILVQYGSNLRLLSDLAGVLIIPLHDTLQDRRTLKEQLEMAGCAVKSTSRKWKTAGRFPKPPANPRTLRRPVARPTRKRPGTRRLR